ncbi:MAG: GntR family transcriptional regulator [Deltaproteobacteria bacterium]
MSDELVDAVQELIDCGALSPGARINEVALAEELEVSRTPLREALNRLAGRGAIQSRPRRGYWTAPLTSEEMRELYVIRAALDPMALRLGGLPDPARLKALRRMNATLRKAKTPKRVVDADNAWHRALLANCPNRLLLSMIDDMIRRTRRYELAYLGDLGGNDKALAEHERIIGALEKRKLERACTLLQRNMETAVAPLAAWLDGREQPS